MYVYVDAYNVFIPREEWLKLDELEKEKSLYRGYFPDIHRTPVWVSGPAVERRCVGLE